MKKINTRKMVFLALLVSFALALSLLENAFPLPIPVPGARLGLSNIVILITIILFGNKASLLVAVLKSVLLLLVTGAVSRFFYGFAGTLLAWLLMTLSYHFLRPPLSTIGVSLLGSFGHNVGQLIVASFVLGTWKIFYYLPILTIIGIVSGYFVGLGAGYVSHHLNRILHIKERSIHYDVKQERDDHEGVSSGGKAH